MGSILMMALLCAMAIGFFIFDNTKVGERYLSQ